MLHQTSITPHPQLVAALTRIRQEWQDAADGKSLLEVEGNIGMLLADLINSVDLPVAEQAQVLGPKLFLEIQDFLKFPAHN